MASKTKKIKASGKFGAGYGLRVRHEYNSIETEQRRRQVSPFHPKSKAKRMAAGIWKCMKTGKIFAGPAYYIEKINK
ncbi:MAG: 50S ribosomal protein L37ae [Nanoarchaeota archaeon]|nr:50S ribosomal protein L37ae [Nanoarchaeota archaeon]